MKYCVTIKIISSLIILTSLIVALSVYTQNLLYKESVKLNNTIEEIQDNVKDNRWDQASKGFKQVSNYWDSIKKTWSALIDHQEIENIDITLSRLKPLLETGDVSSALSEASVLHEYIKHIPEREKLSIDNLF